MIVSWGSVQFKGYLVVSVANGLSVRIDKELNSRTIKYYGEMAEWLKAAVLKTVRGESLSRVRIPLSPPLTASTRRVVMYLVLA